MDIKFGVQMGHLVVTDTERVGTLDVEHMEEDGNSVLVRGYGTQAEAEAWVSGFMQGASFSADEDAVEELFNDSAFYIVSYKVDDDGNETEHVWEFYA